MSEADQPAALRFAKRWGLPLAVIALLAVSQLQLRGEIAELRGEVARLRDASRAEAAAPAPSSGSPPPQEAPSGAPWECGGVIPREEVLRVVGQHGPAVFECHQAHGEAGEPIVLELLLKVLPDGTVETVHIPGRARTPLTECAALAAQGWTFAPRDDDGCATVAVPFSLGAR